MNNSIINTDRLILRHWKETDAEDLYKPKIRKQSQ